MNPKTIKQLKAIANPIRYAIILELKSSKEGLTPSNLVSTLKTSFMNLSFHLSKLENAGLVTQKKKGLNMFYFINAQNVESLANLNIFKK
ncbi:MAG: metalloregulator ArsR/SmtB family transcription factor [Alphaproteobacteria bacterium]